MVDTIKLDKRGNCNDINDIHLLIELTDKCNHRCIMCGHSSLKTMHSDIPASFMDLGLFIKLINELKNSRLKVVSIDPIWAGESLMHPEFKEMASYLFIANKKYGICHGTVINTNAFYLDKEVTDIFLDYGMYVQEHSKEGYYFRLYISLDAATPATYAKIRNVPASAMKRAVENIDYFMKKRKEQKLIIPNVIFSFIIMEENKDEAGEFLEYWEKYLKNLGTPFEISPTWPLATDRDAIYFRQLISTDMDKAMQLHREICAKLGLIHKEDLQNEHTESLEISHRQPSNRLRGPCAALWRTPNIQATGIVVPCCRDINLELNLGSIKENTIDEIWFGDRIKDIRTAHINGDLSKLPVCKNCPESEGEISEEDLSNL